MRLPLGIDDHDENARITRSAAEAVAENDPPVAVMQPAHDRRAVGIAHVVARIAATTDDGAADGCRGPFAHHQGAGNCFREIARIGDVEGVDGGSAGTSPPTSQVCQLLL